MKLGARVALGGLAAVILSGLVTAGVLWALIELRPDAERETVEVQIPLGATGRAIVGRLADADLVAYPKLAYWYLRLQGTLGQIEAGTHELPATANLRELTDLLRRPATVHRVVLTLIPGESVWQAAERFEAVGLGNVAEVLAAAADHAYCTNTLSLEVGQERPPREDGVPPTYLEGFLYPETYFFTPDEPFERVLKRVTGEMAATWKRLRDRRRADVLLIRERYGLSDLELIVLASLVAEEAQRIDEAPRIAGVFYNRIAKGMPLQTDPTLMYHPERVGQPPGPVNRRDGSNPYNTYAHEGLPPGPICSPDARALEAVLAPERHDYLYFVATRDGRGTHAFAATYDAHKANVDRYLR